MPLSPGGAAARGADRRSRRRCKARAGQAGGGDATGDGAESTLALTAEDLLGDLDLLRLGGLVGAAEAYSRAAVRGAQVEAGELQTAVVAVAGVDGPVAAPTRTGQDGVPADERGGGGERCRPPSARRLWRPGGQPATQRRTVALGRTTVLALAGRRGKQHGEDPLHRRLRGECCRVRGRLSCPARAADARLHPKPDQREPLGQHLPWVPRSCLRRQRDDCSRPAATGRIRRCGRRGSR